VVKPFNYHKCKYKRNNVQATMIAEKKRSKENINKERNQEEQKSITIIKHKSYH